MFLEILQQGGFPFINLLYRNLFVPPLPTTNKVLLCQAEVDNQFLSVWCISYNTFTLPWYFHLTKYNYTTHLH